MNRIMLHVWSAGVILLNIAPAGFAGDLYKIDPQHTSIVFSVAHCGLSVVYGFFRTSAGQYYLDKNDPTKSQFQLVIRADSLDTNNAERDKHLRSADFFNVQEIPQIKFESTRCELARTAEGGTIYKVAGNLTLHGVTRPIALTLHMLGEGDGAFKDHRTGFWCQVELKRSEFGMTGLIANNMVGDAVGITISFEGSLQNQTAAPQKDQTRP